MKHDNQEQVICNNIDWQIIFKGTILQAISAFLTAKRSELLSPNTIKLYEFELSHFTQWLETQGVNTLDVLDANTIRLYLLVLSERRNPRGCHVFFRVLRTMLRWYERETDGEYRSPMRKVNPPKINDDPIPGISPETLDKLILSCKNSKYPLRDKSLFLFAFDTGCRVGEISKMNIEDIDFITCVAQVKKGKGGKSRVVFFGKHTKNSLRQYLKTRQELRLDSPLFENDNGESFNYAGLRSLLVRRAKDANVKAAWHGFRRGFAREFLLNDGGLMQLQRILGHSRITTTQIYTKLLDADLAESHRKASPVDRLKR